MERLLQVACHPRRKQHTVSYSVVHLQILTYRVGRGVSYPVVRILKGYLLVSSVHKLKICWEQCLGSFWALVSLVPASYMLTSSGFALFI
jgi:hypothetical protein